MAVNRLDYTQTLPITLGEAWNFFSCPENLCRITPDWLCFDIRHKDSEEMYPGMIIEYSIKAVAGIPMRWLTEIAHAQKPYYFVDEQRIGPYRFWHHQHIFKEVSAGVEVQDIVHYALHLGPVSEPLRLFLVGPKLKKIFDYRKEALKKIFSRSY